MAREGGFREIMARGRVEGDGQGSLKKQQNRRFMERLR
jgi:hypothetical protein